MISVGKQNFRFTAQLDRCLSAWNFSVQKNTQLSLEVCVTKKSKFCHLIVSNTVVKKVKGREAGVYSALQLEEADCTLTP
jgi:hypothetical protein